MKNQEKIQDLNAANISLKNDLSQKTIDYESLQRSHQTNQQESEQKQFDLKKKLKETHIQLQQLQEQVMQAVLQLSVQ